MLRYMMIFVVLMPVLAAPAEAVDTLRVGSPDPVTEAWRWRAFDQRNISVAGNNIQMFEDRRGNLWFDTFRDGLKRYDGYR